MSDNAGYATLIAALCVVALLCWPFTGNNQMPKVCRANWMHPS